MSNLRFIFWDVEHGSATYMATPNGKHFAFDLGQGSYERNDAVFSPLKNLYEQGIRQLDGVVITHPHRDHLDDIFNFDLLSPRVLWRPKHLSEAAILQGNRMEDRQ